MYQNTSSGGNLTPRREDAKKKEVKLSALAPLRDAFRSINIAKLLIGNYLWLPSSKISSISRIACSVAISSCGSPKA
jgi:hypothetical protein